ncbi:HesA/MoeB/ThiF family protein [Desulforudis sp. 1088]|uniref:HesA/MoeB/ThiF family protein n=1 Tax=unclassified Candidatus Desulforudis TaxID=2635950 RepID=UPI003CE4FD53
MGSVRYERSIILPGWGQAGQDALRNARVLVVGAGGLGSTVLMYLAAAGVGTIGIVDGDRVELSNLQRQVLYGTGDVGRSKCVAAACRLADLNPEVRTVEHCTRFSAVNAAGILENYGIAVDCTDNLGTRYDLNEACWRKGIPWVYGAVSEYHGQVSTFIPGRTACFRCLYPVAQEETARHPRGVLNALVGTVGGIQAGEVLKLIIGLGKPLAGRLLVWEALPAAFTSFMLDRDPACPICGT